MRDLILLLCGICIGASGEFVKVAMAEKPRDASAAEQMCQVLVLNHIVRNCHYFEQK